MGITFVLLFPFGAALIRLLNTRIPNAFALHRGLQILNLILAFVGLGIGVWRSDITGTVWNISIYPHILGAIGIAHSTFVQRLTASYRFN